MYSNAHKRKGAAHGTIALGPTVSPNPSITGPLKLGGDTSSKGPFWHVPEDESARKWDFPFAKRDAMAHVEALWRVPFADVLLMPALRPEESLCVPLCVLTGLVAASREAVAAEAGLEELQEVMGEEQRGRWEMMRERGRLSMFNITEEDLKRVTRRFSKRLEEEDEVRGEEGVLEVGATESNVAEAGAEALTVTAETLCSSMLPLRPMFAEHKRQKSSGSSWASMRPPAKASKVDMEDASGAVKDTVENMAKNTVDSFVDSYDKELLKLKEEIRQLRKENQELTRRLLEKERV